MTLDMHPAPVTGYHRQAGKRDSLRGEKAHLLSERSVLGQEAVQLAPVALRLLLQGGIGGCRNALCL